MGSAQTGRAAGAGWTDPRARGEEEAGEGPRALEEAGEEEGPRVLAEVALRGRRALEKVALRGPRARGEAGEEAEEAARQGASEKRERFSSIFELKKWTFKIGKWGRASSRSLLLFSCGVLNALDIERRYEWTRRRGKYRRASGGT